MASRRSSLTRSTGGSTVCDEQRRHGDGDQRWRPARPAPTRSRSRPDRRRLRRWSDRWRSPRRGRSSRQHQPRRGAADGPAERIGRRSSAARRRSSRSISTSAAPPSATAPTTSTSRGPVQREEHEALVVGGVRCRVGDHPTRHQVVRLELVGQHGARPGSPTAAAAASTAGQRIPQPVGGVAR